MRHKNSIEENLHRCRQKITDVRQRVDVLRQCESRMLYTQNEIHSVALSFIDAIRQREKCLIEELSQIYGNETNDYLKKRDELESFLDQLKSTCNLTEMVVKGKDIEMLLLKKQLCDKFDEFEEFKLESLPKNLLKKVNFIPGSIDLGKLTDAETGSVIHVDANREANKAAKLGIAAKISAKYSSFESNDDDPSISNSFVHNEYDDSNEYSEARDEVEDKKVFFKFK